MKYVDLVDIRMGTDSIATFSRGNTSPIVGHPFGMASFAIETRVDPIPFRLFYHPDDHVTTGVRLTHLPSPWIADYAYLTAMPQTGDRANLTPDCKSGYRPQEAVMKPYELHMNFLRYRVSYHLVPTMRGGKATAVWDENDVTHRMAFNLGTGKATVRIDEKNNRIFGTVSTCVWEVPENFCMYFVATFDRAIDLSKTVVGFTNGEVLHSAEEYQGENLVVNLAFEKNGAYDLNYTIATSFIGFDQALVNETRELAGKSFEQLSLEAQNAWEEKLSKIEIEPIDMDQMRTFYSCLYRVFLFPRTFYEINENNEMVHYSPANGKVYSGPMYTDNGFFDTFMTVFPLFSLILAEDYARMCEGFLNYYKESGWLPRWMSPAAINSMPGTFIDQVFADAVAKGIVTDKDTIKTMLEALVKHGTVAGEKPQFGRDGIEEYLKYHYVPSNFLESVNKTENYAYGDFSIAQIAKHLGENEIYQQFMQRSGYYKSLFDSDTTFMKAKDVDGKTREDWTEFDWGWDYTEGGPWQNSFAVPHDVLGLANLMGGKQAMVKKLDRLFDTPPYYRIIWYSSEIHEMTEMAAVDFGQCALSNQPSFHIPYLYSALGRPDKAAYWTRKAVKELFHWNVGFPGDEDNGSMAGWYIFSAMGFYPLCPSVPEYVLSSPAVKRCVIHTHKGNDFEVVAQNNNHDTTYWRDVVFNGQAYTKVYLNHEDVIRGGRLEFTMSSKPSEGCFSDAELPYSVSK